MVLEAEDPEMKQMAHDEEKQLTERKEIVERELKLLLLPKDSQRRKKRHRRNSRRYWRRRSRPFRSRTFSHVLPLRGNTKLEGWKCLESSALFTWRLERHRRIDCRKQGLLQIEI